MADSDPAATHKFVEGIGGRLAASKSAVLRQGRAEHRRPQQPVSRQVHADRRPRLRAVGVGARRHAGRCGQGADPLPARFHSARGGIGTRGHRRRHRAAARVLDRGYGRAGGRFLAACRPQSRREPARLAAAAVLPRRVPPRARGAASAGARAGRSRRAGAGSGRAVLSPPAARRPHHARRISAVMGEQLLRPFRAHRAGRRAARPRRRRRIAAARSWWS